MPKPLIQATAKFDALGRWQQPILDAVHSALPGSVVSYLALPMGRVGLWVVSDQFEGNDERIRESMVREPIRLLGVGVSNRIAVIEAHTVQEDDDFVRHGTLGQIAGDLKAGVGDSAAIIQLRDFELAVLSNDGLPIVNIAFTRGFLDSVHKPLFDSVSDDLKDIGLFAFITAARGNQSIVVDVSGIREIGADTRN